MIGCMSDEVWVAETPFRRMPMPIMRPMTPATSLMPSTTELERTWTASFGFVMRTVTMIEIRSAVSAFHLRKKTSTIGTSGMMRATGFTSVLAGALAAQAALFLAERVLRTM